MLSTVLHNLVGFERLPIDNATISIGSTSSLEFLNCSIQLYPACKHAENYSSTLVQKNHILEMTSQYHHVLILRHQTEVKYDPV